MKFLLVGVSLLFSFIFYVFYTASQGKNIFFGSSENIFFGDTMLGSFIYFPILFFILAVIFYIFFSGGKKQSGPVQKNPYSKIIQYSIILGIIIFTSYYFLQFSFLYIFFIYLFGIILYFGNAFLYKIGKIIPQLYISLNIFSIIFSYFLSLSLVYILVQDILGGEKMGFIHLFLAIIICLASLFHFTVHRQHTNFISLFIGSITAIFSLYSIFRIIIPGIF